MAVAVNKIREHHGRRGPRDKACVAAHMRDQHKEGDAGAGTENDGSTNDVQEFDEIVDHGARAFGFMTAPPARRPLAKRAKDGGRGRTRTYEGVSQRIYSPPPLPLGTLSRNHRPWASQMATAGRPAEGAIWLARQN
jgi:hypothetical protein